MARRALVLGGTGAIGAAVAAALEAEGAEVFRSSRTAGDGSDARRIRVDPFAADGPALDELERLAPLDAAVWAQGANVNDSIMDVDVARHEEVLRANVVFVTATLSHMLRREVLADGARLVVISSIWQLVARRRKLSYAVSKAALAGLVHSAAADLAERGMLVNAVLPSVTDTTMTRSMLSPDQVDRFASETGFGRLTTLADVTSMVCYLCSDANTGVSGQSIAVDLGYTTGRAF